MERERFLISFLLALVLHLLLFLVGQLALKFHKPLEPRYTGPMFVQLEEVPVLASAPAEMEAPPQAGPPSPREPAGDTGRGVPAAGETAPAEVRGEADTEPPAASGPRFRVVPRQPQPAEEPLPEAAAPVVPFRVAPPRSEGGRKPEAQKPEPAAVPGAPLEKLDTALAASRGGAPEAPGRGEAAEKGSGLEGQAPSAEQPAGGFVIQWEDPAQGRLPLSAPLPKLPEWVSRRGQRLKVIVGFFLTPQGILTNVTVEESSGYSDVDAAVIEAVRRWKFNPVSGSRNVRGRVPYLITPD